MNYNLQSRPPLNALQIAEQNQWGLFVHLSQLISFVIPFGGIAAPIIIWQIKKDEFPALDAHGKMIMNWTISSIIYMFAAVILVVLGYFLIVRNANRWSGMARAVCYRHRFSDYRRRKSQ
jgi:uncharacterized Tic20 family protein